MRHEEAGEGEGRALFGIAFAPIQALSFQLGVTNGVIANGTLLC